MSWIDLHIHTTASDGSQTPDRIVELAREQGLPIIAITDHDTMSGVAQAQAAGAKLGVEVIGGIEISTDYRGEDVHLLGYFLNPESEALRPVLDWNVSSREKRNEIIVSALAEDGCPISIDSLRAAYPGTVIGRPHIAEVLVTCGWAESISDAFRRFLGKGCPYYRDRPRMPFREAAEVILRAGGVPVLAHPLQYGYSSEELEEFIADGARCGAKGLEVYYTGYTPEQRERLMNLGRKYGLIFTGGSDYHGDRKPHIQLGTGTGDLRVPETCAADLKNVWQGGH